jgi:tetratricopeptide (TPR) repeat protein/4-amino-4-deoxy-L-arabinose transferase-like glycosyltransferase
MSASVCQEGANSSRLAVTEAFAGFAETWNGESVLRSGSKEAGPGSPDARWRVRATLLLILLLSFALRLYELDGKALWYDELGTALYTEPDRSIVDVVRRPLEVPVVPAPPLYFLSTYLFRQVSDGEFLLRFPSVCWGVMGVAAVYILGSGLLGQREGLVGAFLLTISAFHVRYSQEARYYALLTLLATLSLYFYYRGLRRNDRKSWAGYVAASALAVYTHLFSFLFLAVQGIFAVIHLGLRRPWRGAVTASARERRLWRREPLVSWAGCVLAMAVLYLPMVPHALRGLLSPKGVGGDARMAISGLSTSYLAGIASLLGAGSGLPLFCYLLALGLGLFFLARKRPQVLLLFVLWMLVPFVVVFLMPAGHNFRLRYVIFVLPVFLLAVAHGLVALVDLSGRWLMNKPGTGRTREVGASAMLVLICALFGLHSVWPLVRLWREEKQPWDKAAAFLEEVVEPSHLVVAPVEAHAHRLLYLDYSASEVEYLVPCPCPAPVSMEDWYLFNDLADGREVVWLLDPNPNYLRLRPERWLAQQLDEYVFLPPVVFEGHTDASVVEEELLGPVIASDVAVVPVLRRHTGLSAESILETVPPLAAVAEDLYPGSTRVHFTLGELERLYGAEEEAILQYGAEIVEDPRFYYAYEGIALIHARHGEIPEVLQMYLDLLDKGIVQRSYYHFLLGSVHVIGGDLPDALGEFEMAVRLDPRNIHYRLRLGDAYASVGLLDQAMAQYNEIVRQQPSYSAAYTRRASLYRSVGLAAEAVAECQSALQVRPQSAFAHAMLAGLYFEMGMMDEALAEAREAVGLREDQAAYHFVLGQVHSGLDQLPEAIGEFEEAVRLEPEAVPYHLALADVYRIAGHSDEAMVAYQRALELDPDNEKARQHLDVLR